MFLERKRGYDVRLDKDFKMVGIDVNNDIESDSDSVFELDFSSDGAIRPFMFEPQHSSSEEEEVDLSISQDQSQTEESETERTIRSRIGHRQWCICSNCQVMSTEAESICCQEMDVLGDKLDLEGRHYKRTFLSHTSDYFAGLTLWELHEGQRANEGRHSDKGHLAKFPFVVVSALQ